MYPTSATTGTPERDRERRLSRRRARNPFETLAHEPDSLVDESPIRFELRLARPTQPDASLLTLEVRPSSDQPRRQMLELRELHLELALERARTLRKDVQDENAPIEDPASDMTLQVALLGWSQRMVEEHDLGAAHLDCRADFVGLAGADEMFRIRGPVGIAHRTRAVSPGRRRELAKFVEHAARAGLVHMNEERALADCGPVLHLSIALAYGHGTDGIGCVECDAALELQSGSAARPGTRRRCRHRVLRTGVSRPHPANAGWRRYRRAPGRSKQSAIPGLSLRFFRPGKLHAARWHYGRDRMLVDHLADRIAQQHDELIERLDVALKLDAVDEKDGNRHPLLPEHIEEWVLQRLSLAHCSSPTLE